MSLEESFSSNCHQDSLDVLLRKHGFVDLIAVIAIDRENEVESVVLDRLKHGMSRSAVCTVMKRQAFYVIPKAIYEFMRVHAAPRFF